MNRRLTTLFAAALLLPFLLGATIVVRGPRIASAGITYIIEENFEGSGYPSMWGGSGADCDTSTSGLSLEASECAGMIGAGIKTVGTVYDAFDISEVWLRYRVRPTEIPGSTNAILLTYNSAASLVATINIKSDGTLYVADPGSVSATTVAAMSANTSYWVWFHYIKGSGANNTSEVWFSTTSTKPADGSDNHAKFTNGASITNANYFYFTNSSGNTEHYFDEVRVAASSIP